MILFLSDVHLGRATMREESAVERDLIAFLRSQENRVERLFLLGDIFDHYIEYAYLVPRGFIRFQGLLSEWTDAGIEVTYLVGNHDPWHDDYFEQELGVRLRREAIAEPLHDREVYMSHGDEAVDTGAVQRFVRGILRHPVPVFLYRRLLPGDLGMLLARTVSRSLRSGRDGVREDVVEALRGHARHVLRTTPATTVVMAHSHHAELIRWAEGEYMNTGCWYRGRYFGMLDDDGPSLCRWDGLGISPVVALESSSVS